LLLQPAAAAALVVFQERARSFGGVSSNVRDDIGGGAGGARAGWGLPPIATGALSLAPASATSPQEPGTPLPGMIPGTPGHAPVWGESGTGCYTWGLGMTQPRLDSCVLEWCEAGPDTFPLASST